MRCALTHFSFSLRTISSCNRVWQSAARSLTPAEFQDCGLQVIDRKIRPAFWQENKLGEGALPQKKIGKPLLASRADEQVHFRGTAAMNFRKNVREGLGR